MPRLSSSPIVMGLTRFCFGLAKKTLLAAPMGGMAAAAFDAGAGSLSTFSAWMGVMAFAFQIYFLFSAYADMAAGVVQMTGMTAENAFASPYQADDITDFWKRWHLPVTGWGDDRMHARIAIVLTMLIGALWVGASWGLVIWGGIHLLLLAAEQITGGKSIYASLPKPLKVSITFFILLIAWVFFRADSLADAKSYLAIMFGAGPPLVPAAELLDADMLRNFNTVHFIFCAVGVWAVPNVQTLLRKPGVWQPVIGLALFVLSVFMSSKESGSPEFIRQHKQSLLTQFGGEGNGIVHVGTRGWLFAKSDIRALYGHGPLQVSATHSTKPLSRADAVLEFAGRLKKHGIPLLLVPVPSKATIYPEGLSSGKFESPVYHRDQLALYEQFRSAGIDLIDLAPEMWRLKLRKQVFLQQDSHWTPDAMKLMAESIAKHIRTKYATALKPFTETPIVDARLLDRSSHGDLVAALDVASPDALFSQEQVTLVSIVGIDASPDSTVALIGDSFVSVFDDPALGFTADDEPAESQPLNAGFGHQLAVLLNQPLDVRAESSGSSFKAMREFAAQTDEQLAKKKLVIWVLSASDLLSAR